MAGEEKHTLTHDFREVHVWERQANDVDPG